VEVLVAVAVLALSLGVFVSGGSRYADHARHIQDKTLALWVARNRLVEYQIAEHWPDPGAGEGRADMGGREWVWRSEIEESPDPAVRRAEIRVFRVVDGEPQTQPLARLTGFITPRGSDPTVTATPDPDALPEDFR
jgi:general secretion pathway protein I